MECLGDDKGSYRILKRAEVVNNYYCNMAFTLMKFLK